MGTGGTLSHSGSMANGSILNFDDGNMLNNSQGVKLSVDDFQLLKVVGRGSFGKVYLAKKKTSSQIYAVKTLKKDFIIRTNQTNQVKIERDIMQ